MNDDFSTCVSGGQYEGNNVINRTVKRMGFANFL